MRPDAGCSVLATSFGAELYWGDDPNQTCGVRRPPIARIEDVGFVRVPAPDAGQLAEGTDRVPLFAEAGERLVSVSLLDMAGGLNVANDLLGGKHSISPCRKPRELLECLLDKIQELFLAAMQPRSRPPLERTTSRPPTSRITGSRKGSRVTFPDDISANISSRHYRRFSLPFHDRAFARYGGGLHNCGPNPCLEEYLEHSPAPRALGLSFLYSQRDLPRIKSVCRGRAFVYLSDLPKDPVLLVECCHHVMEQMAPDVIVIPVAAVTTADEPAEVHRRLLEISREYAKRMDWDCCPREVERKPLR
jgi:hypothetical protein